MSRWGTAHDPVGFWTILFAVCGGVLLADLVRLAFGAAIGAILAASVVKSIPPQTSAVRPGQVYVGDGESVFERLPGPVDAKARGALRACIASHVAHRIDNGWVQDLPMVQCIAESE